MLKPLDSNLLNKLGFQKGFIFLNELRTLKTQIKIIAGFNPEQVEEIKKKLISEKILDPILRLTKPAFVNKLETLDTLQKKLSQLIPLASFIIVPLLSKEEPLGFILVGNETIYSPVTTGDVEILFILANQLAVAIENTQLYDQVVQSHQELELRIRERTKELASVNEQLKTINRMKSDFVSSVSHELRTPLTSIKGYASILMEGKLGKVSEEQRIRLAKINKHSDILTKMISDLLDIARIESGRVAMEVKPVLVKEVIDTCIDIMTPQLKEADINLSTDLSEAKETVLADQQQLERVFINLLSNAIKFTPAQGKISIKIKEKKDTTEISVSDTGAGIAPDDLSKVFDEFYRADNLINQEKKGTGLGLALVKGIIEAHLGEIWATSSLGKGTTFTFTLPNSIIKEEEK
jgi:signal transduction histidine kinase